MKFNKVIIVMVLVILFLQEKGFAQAFMPTFSPGLGNKKGMVVTMNNDTIKGTFIIIANLENITSLTIKDENDEKHKLKEEDIKSVLVKFTDMDKYATYAEGASSIKKMNQLDLKEIRSSEYFIWERAYSLKKGKIQILQLVNPGFDSKIKVYRDPKAQETMGIGVAGISITGGIEKSYLVVRNQEDFAIEVKKSKFNDQFDELFGTECSSINTLKSNKKPDWDDLPDYVFVNDQLCE